MVEIVNPLNVELSVNDTGNMISLKIGGLDISNHVDKFEIKSGLHEFTEMNISLSMLAVNTMVEGG